MRTVSLTRIKNRQFPIIVEKDEDGFYVAECPLFQGCYAQGKTLDQCLKNIKEVIALCLEDKHAYPLDLCVSVTDYLWARDH